MSNLYITTTQNVNLFFTPANIGERMLAYFIDCLIKGAYLILGSILLISVWGDMDSQSGYLIIFLFTLPYLIYTLAFELLMEGQTPGKRILKIKVVKIDGYQAGLYEYLIRWFFIIIDIQMLVPAIISIIISEKNQRLGDIAAGTAVISIKSKYSISHTILMDLKEDYNPTFTRQQMFLFSDNDIRIIKENFDLANKQFNFTVIDKLARKIDSVLQTNITFINDRTFIETVLKDYNYYTQS